MKYAEVMKELDTRTVMPVQAPSLEPTRQALAKLQLPVDPERVIVVAGTNGKGSVCAYLESLLIAAGKTVGLYTSPHLIEATERIRINGEEISQEEFARAYEEVMSRTGGAVDGRPLTHFEVITSMACWIFFRSPQALDYVILEVGLGGTWDSTNAVPHRYAVITSLGFDHENLLGNSLVSIASNKFGIIGEDAVVIHSPLPWEVQDLAAQVRTQTRSRWIPAPGFEWSVDGSSESQGEPRFHVKTRWGSAPIGLPGRRGAENATTALTVFETLGFDPSKHLEALARVRWSGRMERVQVPQALCPVYLSGDHNPQGVESLLELLPYYPRKKLHVLVGVGKDKNRDLILETLARLPSSELYLTETPFRGAQLKEYGSWLARARGAWPDAVQAFEEVCRLAGPGEMILVTGSLYLVGEIQAHIRAGTQA